MSATTQTTTEGTAPVAVASPAATQAPSPADIAALAADPIAFEKALMESNLSTSDFDAALNAPSAKPSGYAGTVPEAVTPPPAVAPKPASPAPTAEPAAPTPAPAAPEAGEDPQPEKLGKFRVSARDFKEAEFLRLSKSLPVTEAYAKVYGAAPAPTATAPAAPTAEPAKPAAPVEAPALTEAKTQLATLETQLAKATEDADVGAVAKLMREISKAERAIERAESEAAASARAAESAKADEATNIFRQREAAVVQEVYSAFPKLGDPASPERAEFQQFVNLKYDDPDYAAIFTSPRRFSVLAREFAEAKGWNKAAAPAPAVGTPAPTPGAAPAPRVTAAEVLTPGSTQGGANITAETFVQDVSKMSLKDLDAILAAAR